MSREREQLEQAIATLEAQRAILGAEVVDPTIAALRKQLQTLPTESLTEQRKIITVLFADVSGFTAMSETMDAEEVHSVMNALWGRLDNAIINQGGIIDKHIGDAVMALFGAPTAHEDDPERAIRAALAMQEQLATFRQERQVSLAMRIGIHTGPVLLGRVGTRSEYTAMGDTVNLSSRLEHAAPVGGILISHDTYRHARGLFEIQALEPLSVKGKVAPIQVYVVKRERRREFQDSQRGVEGVETPLVGRDAELRYLQTALETVIQKQEARVLMLVGEAGIGKTRLFNEFNHWLEEQGRFSKWTRDAKLQRINDVLLQLSQAAEQKEEREPSLRFFSAQAREEMRRSPYYLIRDMLASRFRIRESDPQVIARAKLEQGIIPVLRMEEEEARMRAHFIGHLLGLDFAESPHLKGILSDARQIRERAFHYLATFMATLLAEGPVLLFLDHLHWADEGSLDLIESVVQLCQTLPLLVIGLGRPTFFETRPGWGAAFPPLLYTQLEISALSREASQQMIDEILHRVPEIPPDLGDLVLRGAEGNPFYIEELIKMLIEDGVIIKGAEQWEVHAAQLARVQVPPTLTGILQARLDALPQPELEALQQASVVGRVFWDRALSVLNEVGRPQLPTLLDALRSRELVEEREPSTFEGTAEYSFKHAILREVAYESVLLRLRRQYHAQVAEWLIEINQERKDEEAGLIAEHFERAGRLERAAEWYGRAGHCAQKCYAPDLAISYYRKALSLLPEAQSHEGERVQLYEGLSTILMQQAHYTEAVTAYRAMLVAAERTEDHLAQARSMTGLGYVQMRQGEYLAALATLDRAEQVARAVPGAEAELAVALAQRGTTLMLMGEAEKAVPLGQEALALSSQIEAWNIMTQSMNLLVSLLNRLGRHSQAMTYANQAMELCRSIGDQRGLGALLNNLGVRAGQRGDYQAAAELYREAFTIAQQIGYRDLEMVLLGNLGEVHVELGEFELAEQLLQKAIKSAEQDWFGLAEAYRCLAEVYLGQNRLPEAAASAEQALQLAQSSGVEDDCGRAWRARGRIAIEQRRRPIAGSAIPEPAMCFKRSLELFTEAEMEAEQARTLRVWAEYESEAQEEPGRGEIMRQQARAIFIRLGLEKEVERTR
ncbi:MAG: tetratricopeptide repeat protein [Ardenticatenales bacterium]|nr:tetratricopeptide repeat protein [Ardenticatenales bacterium]